MSIYQKIRDPVLTLIGIFKYKTFLRLTEKFTTKQIYNYQNIKLKKLLIYCSKEIDFYKDKFLQLGIDPYASDSFKELQKLPILTKQDVIKNYSRFINSKISRPLEFKTSGTSGNPFSILTSTNQWIIEQGVIWRSWKRAGYKFRDKVAIIRSYNPTEGERKIKSNPLKNWRYYSVFHMDEKNLKEYFLDFKKWKPRYLRGYPGSILILANYAKRNKIKLDCLKGIFTASERLDAKTRNKIEDVFGVKVYDHYGQAEITVMYHNCEFSTVMHEDWEYGFSEYLPTKNKEISRLIATNLNNYCMPLLRYDTGDLVKVSKEKCLCGRNSIALQEILGRKMDFIIDKSDSSYSIVNLFTFFADKDAIKQFQICQYKKGELDVKLKFWESIETNRIEKEKNKISEYLSRYNCDVKFNNDPFHLSIDGKLSPFINRYKSKS